ncbi:hypothetical protein A6J80_18430 [Paracoccus yeei]|uniref:Uncharacterized protein n=1 Tax=Paracoccus yeei TaxID=147645 RepID=A0A1V0GW80_9RHOB|nr:hypothetical protein A6J80_18430 [Paracoccus yeei]
MVSQAIGLEVAPSGGPAGGAVCSSMQMSLFPPQVDRSIIADLDAFGRRRAVEEIDFERRECFVTVIVLTERI